MKLVTGARVGVLAVLLAGLGALEAAATPVAPRLEVRAAKNRITLTRYGHGPVFLDLGVFVAAHDAPLELVAARPSYSEPVALRQVLRGSDGSRTEIELPADALDGWNGLAGFIEVEVTEMGGAPMGELVATFCPGSFGRERVSDDGPDRPTYPEGCFGNPFTKGVVWGIDEGWAVNPFAYGGAAIDVPDGTYKVTVRIAARYVELFGVAPEDAATTVEVTVVTDDDGCDRYCYGHPGISERAAPSSAPTLTSPDPSILPDLVALPAWQIGTEHRRRGDFLTFGSTVWTAGASSLVVEGYRRANSDVMDAFQYFYEDGQVVGRAPVGTLEFDARRGHNHWHFLQFARYALLTEDRSEVVRSKKEAFCLAPTDAIDMTLPGAEWNPGAIGIGTACGGPSSLWVREVLPLGWGDTYFQSLPGQSFNITGLPNGTYYLLVEANPGGLLYEQSAANNVELRAVILKGKPGRRRVIVPPWNGIDTENGGQGPVFPGH